MKASGSKSAIALGGLFRFGKWRNPFSRRPSTERLNGFSGDAQGDIVQSCLSALTSFVPFRTPQARQGIVTLLVAQRLEDHMGCALEDYERTVAVQRCWYVDRPTPGGRQSNCAHMYRYTKGTISLYIGSETNTERLSAGRLNHDFIDDGQTLKKYINHAYCT